MLGEAIREQAQAQREERMRHAHDVLTNDGDLAALHAQVDALHKRYLELLERPQ